MTSEIPNPTADRDFPGNVGVTIERQADRVRISVPPLPRWTHLQPALLIWACLLAALFVYFTVQLATTRQFDLIVPSIEFGAIAAALLLFAIERLHRRVILEVNPVLFVVDTTRSLIGRGVRRWPRGQINEIKRVPSTGRLLLHLAGNDIVEIFLSRDLKIAQWVVDQLSKAHTTLPLAAGASAEVESTRPHPSRHARAAAMTLSFIAVAAAVFMYFAGEVWAGLGIGLLILTAIPVGIVIGHQEREFYL